MTETQKLRKATHYEVIDCRENENIGGRALLSVSHEDGRCRQTEQRFAVLQVIIHYTTPGVPVAKTMRKGVYLYVGSEKTAKEIAEALNRQQLAVERLENCTGSDPGDDPDYAGY